MRAQIAIRRGGFVKPGAPDLKQALRPVPGYERAVREVSRMLAAAGIRHALAGALAANAYRSRPRTTEDIDFLVGEGSQWLASDAGGHAANQCRRTRITFPLPARTATGRIRRFGVS